MTTQTWNSSQQPKAASETPNVENYHLKLWVGTVKSLERHPKFDSTGVLGERNITHVDIFGTVIDRVSLARADIYVLDDGTGVISCHLKKNDTEAIDGLKASIQNDSSIMLISKEGEEGIEALLTLLENEKKEFEIGDTLQVKGRLSFYKEEWKLFANFARVIEFEEECYRCIELETLYENIFHSS